MLLYSNKSLFRQLLQLNGSVVFRDWRQILCGMMLAGATLYLQYLIENDHPLAPGIPNNYGMSALGMIVAFATVFRTNLAWQRYWEAVGQCHFMYSKWSDCAIQIVVFLNVSIKSAAGAGKDSTAKLARLQDAHRNVLKYFALLSAMATDALYHGDAQRMDRRLDMGKWCDQVVMQHMLDTDITGALQIPKLKVAKAKDQPIDCFSWHHTYHVVELPTESEHALLEHSEDRVNLCMAWLVHSLASVAADLSIAPPIQSRMYQELSNGCVGFSACLKITDTPFPFCYSQLLGYLLLVFSFMLPWHVSKFTNSYIAGPLLSFFIFHGMVCINQLASDLENPFGQDIEDIPLSSYHKRFLGMLEETVEAVQIRCGARRTAEVPEADSGLLLTRNTRASSNNAALASACGSAGAVKALAAEEVVLEAMAPATPNGQSAHGAGACPVSVDCLAG